MPMLQRLLRPGLLGLLLASFVIVPAPGAAAQAAGCLPTFSAKTNAQLTAQLFTRGPAGELTPLGGPATTLQARSGQVLRLSVRPLDGPAQPAGAGCPVKVDVGELEVVAKLLTQDGFIFSGGAAYGQFRPGEERMLEFEMRPFEEWSSPKADVELENLVIDFPESEEFISRLPAPFVPPAGTVCAHVVYPDAQLAAGVPLGLRVPPDGPPDRRATGDDGRVCWEGFADEALFGELALDSTVSAALGQSKARYVSRESSYRLFVVKRPR